MKTKNTLIILTLPLLLSGCGFLNPLPNSSKDNDSTNISATSTNNPNSNSETSFEGGDAPNDTYMDFGLNSNNLKSNQLALNKYGDYVEFTSTTNKDLAEEYNKLLTSVKGKKNGVFQTDYQQGLLDFFDYTKHVKVVLDMSNKTKEALQKDYEMKNTESYRPIDLDLYFDDMHFHFRQVGIRQKGNTSRTDIYDEGHVFNLEHWKLSFEETFDDEYTLTKAKWFNEEAYAFRQDRKFFGTSKINFRFNRNLETTYIREHYASNMYRQNGSLAASTNPVSFSVKLDNKEYNLGVYLAVENIDKSFIKRNIIKDSRNGDLYKLSYTSMGPANFNPDSVSKIGLDYLTLRNNKYDEAKYVYSIKTNKTTTSHADLKNFINTLGNTRGADSLTFMDTYSDLDSYVSFLALSYLLGDPDDLRGNYNNAYVFFTGDTHKAIFIPTDLDRVLGSTGGEGNNPTGNHGALTKPFDKNTGYARGNDSNLFNKTLFSTNAIEMRSRYLTRISEIIDAGWMDIVKFNEYFNYSNTNYKDEVKISNEIGGSYVSFSVSEANKDLYNSENLDVKTYMENKVNTFMSNK